MEICSDPYDCLVHDAAFDNIFQVNTSLLGRLRVTRIPCFGYGAVEEACQWVAEDDVKLEEGFDEEKEEKKAKYLNRATQ